MEALEQRAAGLGAPLQLRGLVPTQKERLMSEFPGLFEYTQDRDNYDYIHDIESVATLSGKKLHGKRNFCNRFEKTHDWAFLPIVPDRFDDCLMLLDEWGQENDGGNREEAATPLTCILRKPGGISPGRIPWWRVSLPE